MPVTISRDEPETPGKKPQKNNAKPNGASPKDGPGDAMRPKVKPPMTQAPIEESMENEPVETLPPPDGYKVGYRNPPRETQYKPGQSGNRKGRPKGAKNRKTILRNALARKMKVKLSDGSTRNMSKMEIVVERTIEDAMRGKNPARQMVWKMMDELEEPARIEKDALKKAQPRRPHEWLRDARPEVIEPVVRVIAKLTERYDKLSQKLGRKPTQNEWKAELANYRGGSDTPDEQEN